MTNTLGGEQTNEDDDREDIRRSNNKNHEHLNMNNSLNEGINVSVEQKEINNERPWKIMMQNIGGHVSEN